MKEMVRHAPLPDRTRQSRSLWVERPDGVHVSHDKMEGYLQPYGSSEALTVARNLDAKIPGLLRECTAD
jgi:hypothetical protein